MNRGAPCVLPADAAYDAARRVWNGHIDRRRALIVRRGAADVAATPMKGIRVDAERRVAAAETGVLWGELDRATQAFGLATPGGMISNNGIAGLTLGGGLGWRARRLTSAIWPAMMRRSAYERRLA